MRLINGLQCAERPQFEGRLSCRYSSWCLHADHCGRLVSVWSVAADRSVDTSQHIDESSGLRCQKSSDSYGPVTTSLRSPAAVLARSRGNRAVAQEWDAPACVEFQPHRCHAIVAVACARQASPCVVRSMSEG